jgi:hypothetical protein
MDKSSENESHLFGDSFHGIGARVQASFEKMKFYISTTEIKRVPISNTGAAGKGSSTKATATRRISSRRLLPVVLGLGIALPFLLMRVAFWESASYVASG